VKSSKRGIALLVTLMFVIVITVAIGFGLKQVNSASSIVQKENFMYQSSLIIEDVINILQTSQDVKKIATSDDLYLFLSQTSFIPFEISGMSIVLKISSARGKFNPTNLRNDNNISNRMGEYLNSYGVNPQYLEILADNFGGIKEDNSYNSRIFDENPSLFRDYIASPAHLKIINDFYAKEFNDNSLSKIDFNNLFYFGNDSNVTIDVNYATPEVWELMLGCSKERAETLSLGGGAYSNEADLGLSDDEKLNFRLFKKDYFVPILLVKIEITKGTSISKISFEYNISTKKGSNFVYEI